jgi:hypothetical protein
MIRQKDCIVIHHSATPDGEQLDFLGIRRHHTKVNGWRDTGYHLVLEMKDGQPVAILGRPLHWSGAHAGVAEYNQRGVGVCFVGNYEDEAPSHALLAEGARQIAGICHQLQLDPSERHVVIPHKDVKSTRCPGASFPLARLRDLIVDAM